jgi:hypothetical protein
VGPTFWSSSTSYRCSFPWPLVRHGRRRPGGRRKAPVGGARQGTVAAPSLPFAASAISSHGDIEHCAPPGGLQFFAPHRRATVSGCGDSSERTPVACWATASSCGERPKMEPNTSRRRRRGPHGLTHEPNRSQEMRSQLQGRSVPPGLQPAKEIRQGVESSLHLGLRWKKIRKIRKS